MAHSVEAVPWRASSPICPDLISHREAGEWRLSCFRPVLPGKPLLESVYREAASSPAKQAGRFTLSSNNTSHLAVAVVAPRIAHRARPTVRSDNASDIERPSAPLSRSGKSRVAAVVAGAIVTRPDMQLKTIPIVKGE